MSPSRQSLVLAHCTLLSYIFIFLELNYNQTLLVVYINIIFNICISALTEYSMEADTVSVYFNAMIMRCIPMFGTQEIQKILKGYLLNEQHFFVKKYIFGSPKKGFVCLLIPFTCVYVCVCIYSIYTVPVLCQVLCYMLRIEYLVNL